MTALLSAFLLASDLFLVIMSSIVKRFLRHATNGLWVSRDGFLTDNLCLAATMDSTEHAIAFCRQHKLSGVIVLLFENGHQRCIPLGDLL